MKEQKKWKNKKEKRIIKAQEQEAKKTLMWERYFKATQWFWNSYRG
jgi:hypothetical protein